MKTKLFLMAMLLSFLLPVSANANPVNLNIKDLSLHDSVMLIANAGGINVSLNFDEKDSNNFFHDVPLTRRLCTNGFRQRC